jgi:hypothetical protein
MQGREVVVTATYNMENQPILGPIRVYTRTVHSDLSESDAVANLFGGNLSPALLPSSDRPPSSAAPALSGNENRDHKFAEYKREIAYTYSRQLLSDNAPNYAKIGHPWWDPERLQYWIAVRFFTAGKQGVFTEHLEIIGVTVSSEVWPLTPGAAWTRGYLHAEARSTEMSRSLLASEAMLCAVKMNDNELFSVVRNFRNSESDYLRQFVL